MLDFGPGPAIVAGMGLDLDRLPTDPVLLSKILQEMAGVLEQERAELTAAKATMQAQTLQIEKLEHRVAWLLRVQFDRSREKMNIAQLRLMFDEVDIPEAANDDVPAVVTPKSARKAGRRNWLFIGSIEGGDASALFYSLVETCKLNGVEPEAWFIDVIERIGNHPINRIDELLPWRWQALRDTTQAA